MSITPSDGPLLIVLVCPQWHLARDDERVSSTFRSMTTKFKRLASEKGLLHRFIYANYAHDEDNVLGSYGEEGIHNLKLASHKWDPEGMFQTGVPGGFKIAR